MEQNFWHDDNRRRTLSRLCLQHVMWLFDIREKSGVSETKVELQDSCTGTRKIIDCVCETKIDAFV